MTYNGSVEIAARVHNKKYLEKLIENKEHFLKGRESIVSEYIFNSFAHPVPVRLYFDRLFCTCSFRNDEHYNIETKWKTHTEYIIVHCTLYIERNHSNMEI